MAGLKDYRPLRLRVEGEEDLSALSTSLQDAVAKIGDFAYLPSKRRFAFVANRFVWECAPLKQRGPFARVRAGIHFDDVLAVQQSNLRLDAKDAIISLLAIQFIPGRDGGGDVQLDFSGGGAVKLKIESLNAAMTDMSDPWRTRSKPQHEL